MNLRAIVIFPFVATVTFCQTSARENPSPDDARVFVSNLYTQVVARKPLDVPSGENWKIFATYFSKTLSRRLDTYRACMANWARQYPNTTDKPPGLIEFDIFSGSNEEADPISFDVEKAQTERDGSIRVFVRLRWQEGTDTLIWRVADLLTRENGRLVLDDVVFLKDPTRPNEVDTSLSKLLKDGCDGTHWIGYR
ncbi:MAG TPA: hypothetical protein VG714_09420 [Acidobacteriaceae bacterium]|nr:hypothetical protein [Acidobacteriaceae bacterium]